MTGADITQDLFCVSEVVQHCSEKSNGLRTVIVAQTGFPRHLRDVEAVALDRVVQPVRKPARSIRPGAFRASVASLIREEQALSEYRADKLVEPVHYLLEVGHGVLYPEGVEAAFQPVAAVKEHHMSVLQAALAAFFERAHCRRACPGPVV